MMWLKEEKCSQDKVAFRTAAAAAKHGSFQNMMWLKEQGRRWDVNTFWYASKHENPEILKWLQDNGCPSFARG